MALLDSFTLGTHLPFQGRVQAALVAGCVAVSNEGLAVPNHIQRMQLAHQILQSPANMQNYTQLFAMAIATDSAVVADLTQNGTIAVDGSNILARAPIVSDGHINAALAASVNAMCQGILA